MSKLRVAFGVASLPVVFSSLGRAAEQAVPATQSLFLVKDPPVGPQARKIVWRGKDTHLDGDLSLVGDPTVGGAN